MAETQNILPPLPPVSSVQVPTVQEAPPAPVTFEQALLEVGNSGKISQNDSVGIPLMLFKDHVEITLDNGVKRQIPYQGLKELIDRSLNTKETVTNINGMILPSNVFFLSQSSNELRMTCYYPGGNRDMLFDSTKLNIVTPNILISFTLKLEGKDWIVQSAIYMCTDLPISKLPKTFITGPSPSQGVYLLPMSNTYSEGIMCYGGNSMPARFKDNHFRGMDWYYRYLWETPFNSDLGIRAIGSVVSPSSWYHTLSKFAKENKTFPYRDLSSWRELEGAIPSTSALKPN